MPTTAFWICLLVYAGLLGRIAWVAYRARPWRTAPNDYRWMQRND